MIPQEMAVLKILLEFPKDDVSVHLWIKLLVHWILRSMIWRHFSEFFEQFYSCTFWETPFLRLCKILRRYIFSFMWPKPTLSMSDCFFSLAVYDDIKYVHIKYVHIKNLMMISRNYSVAEIKHGNVVTWTEEMVIILEGYRWKEKLKTEADFTR